MELRIAFIGFGVVGQGLAEILLKKAEDLRNQHGFEYKVVAITTRTHGAVYDENGLDLKKILELVRATGKITDYPYGIKGLDSLKTITETNANLIVEVTCTNIQTGEPAISYVKTALNHKKHVVMTNKGPIILAARELIELAKKNNRELGFEGTVLSGTPALNLGLQNLADSNITKVQGIINGTTNYILTEMENGLSYEEALQQAQELGYAESDPTADVEGFDALGKIWILANVIMKGNLTKEQIPCQGIANITSDEIIAAKNEGKRWKLIAGAELKSNGSIEAYVHPEKVPLDHPLASVNGPINALTYTTHYLGDVTIVGPGAGQVPTGYALLSDILNIHQKINGVCPN